MEDFEKVGQIESYLTKQMTGDELRRFEKDLEQNTEFASEVADYALLLKSFKSLEIEKFQNRLKGLEPKEKPQPMSVSGGRNARPLNWLWKAAAVILIAGVGAYWLKPSNNTALASASSEELYSSYFYKTENYIVERNADTSTQIEKILIDGIDAYEKSNYKDAVKYLNEYLSQNPDRKDVAFYLGISMLQEGLTLEAKQVFTNLTAQKNHNYYDHSCYYLALTCIKLDEKEDAKHWLTQVVKGNSKDIKPKAEGLLKQL